MKYDLLIIGPEDMKSLRAQGITDSIYTGTEITELSKLPKESLKTIHAVKLGGPLGVIER